MLLATGYAVCWAAGMAWSYRAPTLDSAEQLVWSYSLEGGYWKHPPMPSWILHGLAAAFGPSVALPFFAAQACTAIALALMWRLGCEFMSPQRSLAAAALGALVGYHGWSAYEYNHDTVLLPFQAAMFLAAWFALRSGRWSAWALAGACAGAGLLVKYVAVFPLAALAVYFACHRRLHTRRQLAGIALATLVAAAICAPHIVWLVRHDFPPFRYAHAVAAHAPDAASWLRNIATFLFWQLAQAAPLLLVLAWAWRRRPAPAPAEATPPRDRLFLWAAGVGPCAILLAYALATGTQLEPRWGSTLFLGVGWLLMDMLPNRAAITSQLLRASAWMQLAVWVAVALAQPALIAALHWPGRANFPGRQFAALAMDTWRQSTGEPLRLVLGDVWLAGTLIARQGRLLAVQGDASQGQAAWIQPADLQACGALVLQDRSMKEADRIPEVTRLIEAAPLHGEWVLPWAPRHGLKRPNPEQTRIGWAVLPPRAGGSCRL